MSSLKEIFARWEIDLPYNGILGKEEYAIAKERYLPLRLKALKTTGSLPDGNLEDIDFETNARLLENLSEINGTFTFYYRFTKELLKYEATVNFLISPKGDVLALGQSFYYLNDNQLLFFKEVSERVKFEKKRFSFLKDQLLQNEKNVLKNVFKHFDTKNFVKNDYTYIEIDTTHPLTSSLTPLFFKVMFPVFKNSSTFKNTSIYKVPSFFFDELNGFKFEEIFKTQLISKVKALPGEENNLEFQETFQVLSETNDLEFSISTSRDLM